MKVPIISLTLPDEVIQQVNEILRSGMWVDGAHVASLEREFAQFCQTKFCRAVSSGTDALMAMMAVADFGPGDQIIVPSFSFIATANCLKFTGATPVFADIDPITFTIDPNDVEKKITPHTKAIMPVHIYGLCADMKNLQTLCKEKNLILMEDAAQAHGAEIQGKKSGSFGLAGGFSLYPTKNMFTAGEGGLITTDNEEFYNKTRLFVNHGQAKKYYHTDIGYNFRLSEINAVIAQYSLKTLNERNQKRITNAKILSDLLNSCPNITLPTVPSGYVHVYHQYTIRSPNREKIIGALQKNDIGFGIHYGTPIHLQPFYQIKGIHYNLPETERAAKEVLSLPAHSDINEEQLHFVADTIKKALQ
jgi:dTDP-4-amino-4,6-dideoxygalactose transaminase